MQMMFRVGWQACFALIGMVLWGSAQAGVAAQGVNLIANPYAEGPPGGAPRDMFHGITYDRNVGRASRGFDVGGVLVVSYRYGKTADGRPYTDVELVNNAPNAANYTLNLSTQRMTLMDGETYSLSANVSALAVRQPVVLALGFQFYKSDGGYLSDMAPDSGEFKDWLGESQTLSASYVGGSPEPSSGQVPNSFYPRLAVYNLPPDATLRFRLSGIVLKAAEKVSAVRVLPLKRPMPDMAPGQVLPLSVTLAGKPGVKPTASRLTLQSVQGGVQGKPLTFDSEQPLQFGHWGHVTDVWQVRLPAQLPLGTYAVTYELPGLGVKAKLGDVVVAAKAGMWVGQAIHRYPGSSESTFGPFQGRYQFVRSLASDYAHRMQWWLGPDEYDWKGLSKWAQYHAAPGERKLVFTFSGSPRWASSEPNQPAAMGVPGNAAPPAPEYRKAYQRMVKDTVAKFKDRILASECWNEPNSPDFYTGTKTELADLCKSVYVATKSVDPKILVICPQADDPSHLDFVYSAKTSAGEPIVQFCDLVGSHLYNRMGMDLKGRDYARQRLMDGLDGMVAMSKKYGIDKPLAVTEYGLNSCVVRPTPAHPQVFGRMASDEAAEAMYRAVAGFREYGVTLLALYSYDHPNNDPNCRPGGSFIRMTYVDKWGDLKIDSVMAKRVGDAVLDFGRAGGD